VGVYDVPALQVILQILGKVARSVVGKQAGTEKHIHPAHPGLSQGDLERLLQIRRVHGGRELPGQDATGVIIQDRGQVVPTPAHDLEVGEVCLPEFVHPLGGMIELVLGRHHSKCRALHQIASSRCPSGKPFRMRYKLDSEMK